MTICGKLNTQRFYYKNKIDFIYKQSANGGIQIKKEINGSDERIFLKLNAIQQEYIDKMMDVYEFLKSQQSKAIPIL